MTSNDADAFRKELRQTRAKTARMYYEDAEDAFDDAIVRRGPRYQIALARAVCATIQGAAATIAASVDAQTAALKLKDRV